MGIAAIMSAPHKLKKRELLELVWSKPMTALASDFGLSPNGLAKICDRVDIERPPKGFWANGVSPDIEALVGALDEQRIADPSTVSCGLK